jgi:hypothetical protein
MICSCCVIASLSLPQANAGRVRNTAEVTESHLQTPGLLILFRRQVYVDSIQIAMEPLAQSDKVNPISSAYLELPTTTTDFSSSYTLH